jgi:hypothetical protein
MLPQLLDFGINFPVYLRKIDRLSHWHPENSSGENRVNKVADKVFPNDICSLWYIGNNEEFYGMVAAISARRKPRQQDIDFIYLTEEELEAYQIIKKQTIEGQCLFVARLHYNIEIDKEKARNLCQKLIEIGREPKRCKKKMTQFILEYQQKRGCKAVVDSLDKCECELESVVEF